MAAGLSHDFTKNYPGNYRVAGKVPLTKERGVRNAVRSMANAVCIQGHGVQKQHGPPVGDKFHYAILIHCKV